MNHFRKNYNKNSKNYNDNTYNNNLNQIAKTRRKIIEDITRAITRTKRTRKKNPK